MKQLDEAKKSYICLAPTHKACRVMSPEAMTLHKFCNLLTTKKCVQDYIIIDEKSMMLEVFYNTLYKLKKNNPNTKCIVSGDWKQLEAVADVILIMQTRMPLMNWSILIWFNCQNADVQIKNYLICIPTLPKLIQIKSIPKNAYEIYVISIAKENA